MSAVSKDVEEMADEVPAELVRMSAWAYLRTMLLIAWSAFRHPFSTTIIDMRTGECVHEG